MARSRPELGVIFSVTGVLGIGAARLAYERFYRELGIGLDELALSNWRLLGTSVQLILVTTAILAPALCGLAAALAASEAVGYASKYRMDFSERISSFGLGLMCAAVALAAPGATVWLFLTRRTELMNIALLAVGLLCVAAPFMDFPGFVGEIWQRASRWLPWSALIVATLFWSIIWLNSQSAAQSFTGEQTIRTTDTQQLLEGRGWLSPQEVFQLIADPTMRATIRDNVVAQVVPAFDVWAPPVCVVQVGNPDPNIAVKLSAFHGTPRLLGRPEGSFLLYDGHGPELPRTVLRVPADMLILTNPSKDGSCN